MSTNAESRAEGLRKAMEDMVNQLDRTYLRPMQKDGFLCAAKCCDTAAGQADLQQCVSNCERKVHTANNIVNGVMQDFQGRLQRCVQRCQDKAQETLPSKPSERDIEKAQSKLADCMADCAQEYERLVPKLKQDIVAQLKSL